MRKYLSILVIFILLVGVTFTIKNSVNNNTILDNVILKDSSSNSSMFAIMVENDDGEYVEYDGNSFPTNMAYNSSLSGCIDSNGNTLDIVLSFNSVTSSATVSTSETAYCYLYFDIVTTLANAILLAENDSSTVSEAVSYIVSKGEPDFSTTSTTDEGLYAAEDDYGTSYYFRGAVEDNYVYFAGFYWRIVRINGDGSVRLIYDGTEKHENGESSSDRMIGTTYYYPETWDTSSTVVSNGHVGYMYGNYSYEEYHSTTSSTAYSIYSNLYASSSYTYNSSTGQYTLGDDAEIVTSYTGLAGYYMCMAQSRTTCNGLYYIYSVSSSTTMYYYSYSSISTTTSYEDEHANINDSTIKEMIDEWYESNIYYISDGLGNVYSDYISDTLFCADRSLSSSTSGDGIGGSSTIYSAYDRLKYSAYYNAGTYEFDNNPILTCKQQNDRFTVDDTKYGNGDLTYPVATITADEVVMAGNVYGYYDAFALMDTSDFSKYYLYTGYYTWTMTPSMYSGYSSGTADGVAVIFYLEGTYGLMNYFTYTAGNHYVRPVINLSSSVVVTSGDGTYDSPYEVALS